MYSEANANPARLKQRLVKSPVSLILGRTGRTHACLCLGLTTGREPKYRIVNPCQTEVVNFGSNDVFCSASGTADLPVGKVERELGSRLWSW